MYKNLFPIVESFTSVQGEGIFVGKPAFFLRTKKCNLYGKCLLDCDTFDRVRLLSESWLPYDEICKKCIEYKHIVITGGEPTLYNDYIHSLLVYLNIKLNKQDNSRAIVEIETNGYDIVDLMSRIHDLQAFDFHVNFSPKTTDEVYIFEVYKGIKEYCNCSIKVVVFDKTVNLVKRLSHNKEIRDDIVLMPLGKTPEELEKSWPTVMDLSLRYKLRTTPRLHIYSNVL